MWALFDKLKKNNDMEWFEIVGTVFFIIMILFFGNNGRGLMER